jgi:tRNA-dihydrouridine synthase 1
MTGLACLGLRKIVGGRLSIFENIVPDPVKISLEYLDLCREYPGIASMTTIQAHVRHFIEFQW